MNDIDIEALKNDKEFLEQIEALAVQAKEERSIVKAYQYLDALLVLEEDEESINETFTFIVNEAFDKLAGKLSEGAKFDVSEDEALFTVRAIYEHAMERYSDNDFKGAKEMFLALHHTLKEEALSTSMLVHVCVTMDGVDFETFIESMVDMDNIDPTEANAYFVTIFSEPTDVLLERYSAHVTQAKKELESLEESR